ncbi:MAG: hypothetical protein CMP23_11960 [Rickettsiales bacterium]|nr:hypothetical protein [Rickettsiales bacterium]|tara:strand:- start:3532 stop:4533 length:1002 start_codon:yes stop_codon:yes gene_type:complete
MNATHTASMITTLVLLLGSPGAAASTAAESDAAALENDQDDSQSGATKELGEAPASAKGDTEPGTADETSTPVAPELDPITSRLLEEVQRYYSGIGGEPSPQQLQAGLDSARFMLLEGVAIDRITAAVSRAIELHSPGRSVNFEIAVPLRVRPVAETKAAIESSESAPTDFDVTPRFSGLLGERNAEVAARNEQRRNRIRLYRQWSSRNSTKRILLTIGVPTLAIPYSLGFLTASLMSLTGVVPRSWAFVTTAPLVGTMLLGIWTEGLYPGLALLTITQAVGLATLVVGLAVKSHRPKDDPTALRIGRRKDGSPAVTLRGGPMGMGAFLRGSF